MAAAAGDVVSRAGRVLRMSQPKPSKSIYGRGLDLRSPDVKDRAAAVRAKPRPSTKQQSIAALAARIQKANPTGASPANVKPMSPEELRKVRATVIANAAMRQAAPDVKASARQAPSAEVSGALNVFGPNLYRKLGGDVQHPSIPKEGSTGWAALEAAGLLPFGRPLRALPAVVKGAKALLAGKTAVEAGAAAKATYRASGPIVRGLKGAKAARTLKLNEKVQQLPAARSRVTKTLIEKPSDVASQAMMGEGKVAAAARKVLPTASAEARVAKAAGREQAQEAGRTQAGMARQIKALPKEGSPEDIAHSWWAQLPKSHRNAEGLKLVRAKQAAELEQLTSGKALKGLEAQAGAVRAQLGKQSKPSDPLRAAYREYRSEEGLGTGGMDFDEYADYARKHKPGLIKESEDWAATAGSEVAVERDPKDVFDLIGKLQDLKLLMSDLPQRVEDLSASMARLDQVIAKPPRLDERVIGAVRALSADRRQVLEQAEVLKPERAAAREGLVSRWLGLEPTGEEAFLGHRLGKVRGAQQSLMPVSVGTGRVKLPQGVARENKLVLAKSGRLRESTRVAVEDWQAAQVYRSATTSRRDLSQMGKPFEGRLPEGTMLVNPKGRAVPPHWKTDKLAKIGQEGFDQEEVYKAAQEIVSGFLADPSQLDDMLKAAKASGVRWDELRVVPEQVVKRYYGQFTPARGSGKIAKVYDAAVDFTAASIVFARLGYIPKNIAQNLIMAVPHQGAFLLVNAPRAGQALADPQLRTLLSAEVGFSGPTQGLSGEARYGKALRGLPAKAASVVGSVADTPMRISAFIHEAAAAGVIPKLKPVLSDADKAALVRLLTDKQNRPLLNDIRARANEAMADFSRMTPAQRRWARRFLIIPGWLWAGSRYPAHFAATHPGRSAALAYVGAGEPGAPDRLQVNKPVNEYFAKGLPSYLEGIDTGEGKVLRTTSLSPVNTPYDIAMALAQRSPDTAVGYGNPFAKAVYNILNRTVDSPRGPYRTDFQTAVTRNLERIAPNVRLARDLISPDGEGNYPEDATRLGRLKREVGVLPIEVKRASAGGTSESKSIYGGGGRGSKSIYAGQGGGSKSIYK